MSCRRCEDAKMEAREWAALAEQRRASVRSAEAREAEARARAADHAAAHPYRGE